MGPPASPQAAHTAELKAQQSEAFPFAQVYDSTLLLIDFDSESGELLLESLQYRPE
jgi:hypothetical protein